MMDEEPEAYKLGWIPFLGLEIGLASRPLIPRPETEWWTEQLIGAMSKWSGPTQTGDPRTFAKGADELRFLDLCAGSGAIGCAILQTFPEAHVYFGEIDPAHEATIRKNIAVNGLDASRAIIGLGDLFVPFGDEQFDFIAANPPYIPQGRELPASVANYEPALALRAGVDGLAVIRRIAEGLPRHLRHGGQAWVECDSEHATSACSLFTSAGFTAEVSPDQYGRPRIIIVSRVVSSS
jgi:release factor glutamine methyltransferase